jgi:hypothetical protein
MSATFGVPQDRPPEAGAWPVIWSLTLSDIPDRAAICLKACRQEPIDNTKLAHPSRQLTPELQTLWPSSFQRSGLLGAYQVRIEKRTGAACLREIKEPLLKQVLMQWHDPGLPSFYGPASGAGKSLQRALTAPSAPRPLPSSCANPLPARPKGSILPPPS